MLLITDFLLGGCAAVTVEPVGDFTLKGISRRTGKNLIRDYMSAIGGIAGIAKRHQPEIIWRNLFT
jgi:hypothetical protein